MIIPGRRQGVSHHALRHTLVHLFQILALASHTHPPYPPRNTRYRLDSVYHGPTTMQRRHFLLSSLSALPPVRINRITLAPIQGQFHKFVAMNAYDKAPKGRAYDGTLVRIGTNQGLEGVGTMSYPAPDAKFQQAVRALLNANPFEIYAMNDGLVTGRKPAFASLLTEYKHLDGPLFDLLGKLHRKPCWKLMGASARERVETYDGTLYFSDVWFKDRGVAAVVDEVEEAQRQGYRGVKLKLGRGSKWMSKDEGLARDIGVVHAVRKASGPSLKIMVDANNGYRDDFEGAWKLLAETKRDEVYWLEEPFPETVEGYTRLRERMEKAGMKTLIADGENLREASQFEPYLKPNRLMDVVQLDIRTGGFIENLKLAKMAESAGAVTVPHNWGSRIGVLMGLHFAKVVANAPIAEDDRSSCDAVIAEGYSFAGGSYTVSELPGLGLRVDEEVYARNYRSKETVIS
ncbi:MAG: mandelate racemase/muconate lactonizing enzyme family protein [Bryobacterales bacterium]|nr:mandelate racemase/muconate lactonizing enzyme family protein [Bryobacterales bacterium]